MNTSDAAGATPTLYPLTSFLQGAAVSASTLMKMRKLPGCRTPSVIWTLMEPPGGIGEPSATLMSEGEGPAAGPGPTALTASEELKTPPDVFAGGVSSVVCCTAQLFEGQAGFVPVIETVAGDAPEVMTRRSAVPSGALKVERSMTRKRRRVMGWPVLFVTVRRIESVPKGPSVWFGVLMVGSRKRLGDEEELAAGSSSESVTAELSRWTGECEFSGPGAPRRAPAPMSVPVVSAKKKSDALSPVSFGRPFAGQGPAAAVEPPLPHRSRTKAYSRFVAATAG